MSQTITPTLLVLALDQVGLDDIPLVGGKNASLGEMIQQLSRAGVRVPGGFATSAAAYRLFLRENALEEKIDALLHGLDVEDHARLRAIGAQLRDLLNQAPMPAVLDQAIREAYAALPDAAPVAVRSSATAEDLPEASFAGQQESYLNVRGADAVVAAVRNAYASLFTDRAIAYRQRNRFDHKLVALSAGVQHMVRSDKGSAGVAFTIDTESGCNQVITVTAAYGLGETVVQGLVNPDEFSLYKPNLASHRPAILHRVLGDKAQKMIFSAGGGTEVIDVTDEQRRRYALNDQELAVLGEQCLLIEQHYGRAMDIEWGKDGEDGLIYILQARPETVASRSPKLSAGHFHVRAHGPELIRGHAVGRRVGIGRAFIASNLEQASQLQDGDVLVTDITDPDWGPLMKRTAAIVTNRGGRACHAAIVARELGLPAVVGCQTATQHISHGQLITVSCAEGDKGFVYQGSAEYEIENIDAADMPDIPVDIMLNLADPGRAFELAQLPARGVGLARLEFIINGMIGVHPGAILQPDRVSAEVREQIRRRSAAYPSPEDFYVMRLAEGIATIAAAFAPRPVIVRTSDFKSNEYANLIGGEAFEPIEGNPMIGFRGAGRYVAESFRPCFELECRALRLVREDMGLDNVRIMIPFLRTLDEARAVVELLARNGLRRGEKGLKLIMMCELPSNAVLADQFLEYFDGFSIGSNDLTQLTLGMDRDSAILAPSFDERDPAVKALMSQAINRCRAQGKYIGICGQGPSDHPDLAQWLLNQGIESMSLNPDSVIETWMGLHRLRDSSA